MAATVKVYLRDPVKVIEVRDSYDVVHDLVARNGNDFIYLNLDLEDDPGSQFRVRASDVIQEDTFPKDFKKGQRPHDEETNAEREAQDVFAGRKKAGEVEASQDPNNDPSQPGHTDGPVPGRGDEDQRSPADAKRKGRK